jgi:hypothetical protein
MSTEYEATVFRRSAPTHMAQLQLKSHHHRLPRSKFGVSLVAPNLDCRAYLVMAESAVAPSQAQLYMYCTP